MTFRYDDLTRENWYKYGACRGLDPNLFFPEVGVSRIQMANVKAVCQRCVVKEMCLEDAIGRSDDPEGIWGGTTERERRELRRIRKRQSA